MAAKDDKPKNHVKLTRRRPTDKVSIEREQWKEAMEDQKRAIVIEGDIGFGILLTGIIERTFPQRTKDVQKLMNSTNMNMIQKARLAYILGLINKMVLKDLEQIHEIRNKFSHSFEASFAYTKVLKSVRKLSTATANGQEVTAENSYEFYKSAGVKCLGHIIAIADKQRLKEAQQD